MGIKRIRYDLLFLCCIVMFFLFGCNQKKSSTGENVPYEYELLEGYDEITRSVDKIQEAYLDENKEIENKDVNVVSNKIYEYGLELVQSEKIDNCFYEDTSNCVTFVLKSGTNIVYIPPVKETYQGNNKNFSVISVNTSSGIDNVVSPLFNSMQNIHTSGKTIYERIDNCSNWEKYDSDATLYDIQNLFEQISNKQCRMLLWRGHGGIQKSSPDNIESFLVIGEKLNETTSNKYSDDIKNNRIGLTTSYHYYIAPGFINKYMSHTNSGGLFLCGSCSSLGDGGKLALAFFNKGYDAVVGNTNAVSIIYSDKIICATAKALCEPDPLIDGATLSIRSALKKAEAENKKILFDVEFKLLELAPKDEKSLGTKPDILFSIYNDDDIILNKVSKIEPFRLVSPEYITYSGNGKNNRNDFVTMHDGIIYYCTNEHISDGELESGFELTEELSEERGLYSLDTKTNEKKLLIPDILVSSIEIVNNAMYFSISPYNRNNEFEIRKLYKLDLGTGKSDLVSNRDINSFFLFGEWIYYPSYEGKKTEIRKQNLDGSSDELFIQNSIPIRLVDCYLHYWDGNQKHIYNLLTNEDKEVSVGFDDVIYITDRFYRVYKDDFKIISYDQSMKNERNLFDKGKKPRTGNIYLNADDQFLYYSIWTYEPSELRGIYRMKFDGSDLYKISDDNVSNLSIVGDWIYYRVYGTDCMVTYDYKIKTDGSERQHLDGRPGLIN